MGNAVPPLLHQAVALAVFKAAAGLNDRHQLPVLQPEATQPAAEPPSHQPGQQRQLLALPAPLCPPGGAGDPTGASLGRQPALGEPSMQSFGIELASEEAASSPAEPGSRTCSEQLGPAQPVTAQLQQQQQQPQQSASSSEPAPVEAQRDGAVQSVADLLRSFGQPAPSPPPVSVPGEDCPLPQWQIRCGQPMALQ